MDKSKAWINSIDLNVVDIYPIQFANCDRLRKNDAVYIFDEVGSGKTISSGLMALDYLYNHPDKKVLVITTNALVKKTSNSNFEYGQFLNDWAKRLPFEGLKLMDRIELVNNHYSNLVSEKSYGLIIVDEAHLFLNTESKRYTNLCNLRTEKIVFLTATPIKSQKEDLSIYVKIARAVTAKKIPDDWIAEISTFGKEPEEIICSGFDETYPVTRYFKDTIKALNVEGFQKTRARRLHPQLWEYGGEKTKDEVLLEQIVEKCKEKYDNRFIVFTRFVEKEAKAIGELLKNNGFQEFSQGHFADTDKTYKIVTGENGADLRAFERTADLPTVLILTYQIAEQGVNLPGYNHVVNYHISAFPSALEQRFGRIDRMKSIYPEINICFLIAKGKWDTNTWNFYCAIHTYLCNLISYLPSRNTILSTDMIQKYSDARENVKVYKERIEGLLEQPEQMARILDYYEALSNTTANVDESSVECLCDEELFQFIEDNGLEPDLVSDRKFAEEAFKREVKNALAEYFNLGEEKFSKEEYIAVIESVSDKIFYSDDKVHVNIRTIDAIEKCGEEFIAKSKSFKDYSKRFREEVKFPILIANYLKGINAFFEEKFMENDFQKLFPYEGYAKLLESYFDAEDEKARDKTTEDKAAYEVEKQLILDNSDKVIPMLPIFKLFRLYGDILRNQVYTVKGEIRVRFDFNPFVETYYQTKRAVLGDVGQRGLSDEFVKQYFKDITWDRIWDEIYCFHYDESKDNVQASNWYKLAYHYTRIEEACFMNKRTLCMKSTDNFYKKIEELFGCIVSNYAICYDAKQQCWREEEHQPAGKENLTFAEKEKQLSELTELWKKGKKERDKHQSLFNHFVFSDDGNNYRAYLSESMRICNYRDYQTSPGDWWTQGIKSEFEK